jgi:hypothetical protein
MASKAFPFISATKPFYQKGWLLQWLMMEEFLLKPPQHLVPGYITNKTYIMITTNKFMLIIYRTWGFGNLGGEY